MDGDATEDDVVREGREQGRDEMVAATRETRT